MIEYDKKVLVNRLVLQLEQNKQVIANAAERARQDSINAEGRMQTRYGSEKEESGYLADGLSLRKGEVEKGLETLAKLQLPASFERVSSGALVSVKQNGYDPDLYFILPYGGGETLEVDGREITVLSPVAPIARAMTNKRKGENFSFGKTQYIVEDVK